MTMVLCLQVGPNGPDIHQSWDEDNHEMLPSQQLLPHVREISGRLFIFQQNSTLRGSRYSGMGDTCIHSISRVASQ